MNNGEVTTDEFFDITGILSEVQLVAHGIDIGPLEPDEDGGIETYKSKEINAVLAASPSWHLCTMVDGDDEDCTAMVNRSAFVNRLKYYIATKSKEDIYAIEKWD